MPLYEFHCPACEKDFELLVRGKEEPHCPSCASTRLEKLPSAPAAPAASRDLPLARSAPGTCGRPQCGGGGCMMES